LECDRKPDYGEKDVETPTDGKVDGETLKRFEELKKLLSEVDIAKTTPLEALLKLAQLKDIVDKS